MKEKGKKLNIVLAVSLLITLSLVVWAAVFPDNYAHVATSLLDFFTTKFGWLYTICVGAFLIWAIWICCGKYGKIKLGPDDSEPEYSTAKWFAMLFSSGMGIGIVFWGVAEPLTHYVTPIGGIEPGSKEAMEFAIQKSLLHWCLHPWAIFCVVGLGLAYMQFRKNEPGLISRLFVPLVGEKTVNGWFGKTVDILAVFATVAGLCTSLGLGTMQINAGLNHLFGVPETETVQVIIIIVIAFLFTSTAIIGIEKGISVVSDINMVLAFLAMVLAFVVGPKVFQLNILSEGIGDYLSALVADTFAVGAYGENAWYGKWTIFYWAWWVAWAPFVGSFIARISKGRTIREFVAGVLIVPAVLSFLWFAVFGGMGLNLGPEVAEQVIGKPEIAGFLVFSHYKFGTLLSGIVVCLVCTFFVTSANSGTFVLGIFSSNGNLNPTGKVKGVWGVAVTLLSIFLLLSSEDGLAMTQSISIVGAFPFLFVMIGCMFGIAKALKKD